MTDEDKLDNIEQVALDLYEKYKPLKMIIDTPNYHFEVNAPIEERVVYRDAFSEAHKYLKNAKRRCNTKTPEGYSDCKANCRNALISTLQTLTGKEKIKEATKELINHGMLGEREAEFIETFEKLLTTLFGLASKKGSHPPMTRNKNDADLALNLTAGLIDYIVNQATLPRD